MFDIIAHRGASNLAPENTLSSISKAIELAVNFIEIDVHLSKDGIPVVIHDAMLRRTTDAKTDKRITDMTLKEIKSLDAGIWFAPSFSGEKIPTLTEVLELKRGPVGIMIEIKKGQSQIKTLVKAVCDLLSQQQNQQSGDIIVGSFSPNIVEEIQVRYPTLQLIGIAEDFNMISFLRSKKLQRFALWYKLINPALMQTLHDENTKVWAFTVDDPKIAEFLLSIHVDGLITNNFSSFLHLKNEIQF